VADQTAAQAAARLFAANHYLKFYLILADRPPRVVAIGGDGVVANYTAAQKLPDDLPWSAACQPPVLGDALLAWDLDRAAEDALREIATVPLMSRS
jgi:hypothetical protein